MSTTAPYDARAADEITQSVEVTYRLSVVDVAGVEVCELVLPEGGGLVLTMNERWAPHARLEGTAVVPDEVASIDPRTGTRLVLELGYRYAGGDLDQHPVADLLLETVNRTHGAGVFDFVAESDERVLEKWDQAGSPVTYPPGALVLDVITAELTRTLGVDPVVTAVRSTSLTEQVTFGTGTSYWDTLLTLADQADVWLYCDALRVWRVRDYPQGVTQPVAHVVTGPAGTLTGAETALSREGWGNAVLVEYEGGVGWAQETQGPMGTDTVPVCVHRVARKAPYPGSIQANVAAASILRRVITTGGQSAYTALAAWWVRPGDAVTDTDQHAVIAAAVRFNFPAGTMTLNTREPEVQ